MLGKTISHYKIIEKLGEGGMGVVYKARDTKLDRTVAIKILPPHLGTDAVANKRFVQEAKAASALDHPNICTIHEIDETAEEQTFIVMAYYEGGTLRERIDSGSLTTNESVAIASQLASGLTKAHEKGIIHRDIKPRNILLTSDGKVKIIDFGLAKLIGRTKLTRNGSTVGTAAYMSPEQAKGEEVDHRSDIFSLGTILYEMLTGERPFRGEHDAALLYAIVHEDFIPLNKEIADLPKGLIDIVGQALNKNVEERYHDTELFSRDLKKQLQNTDYSQNAKPVLKTCFRRRSKAALILSLCVILTSMIMIYLVWKRSAEVSYSKNRIAVLPFMNIGSAEDEYFADGLTEEIIARLVGIGELKVIARTSVLTYKNTEKSIKEIGRELGVDHILEGTVRWSRNKDGSSEVRITPQLIKVSDETHVWANIYEEPLEDIFDIQASIALAILSELAIVLRDQSKAVLVAHPTENLEAYDNFLRGMDYYNKGIALEDQCQAIEYFFKAAKLDSTFVKAHAWLSMAYSSQYYQQYSNFEALGIDTDLILRSARREAESALRLDPNLADSHLAYAAYVMIDRMDIELALKYVLRANDLQPNNANILVSLGGKMRRLGMWDKSLVYLEKSVELDPRSPKKLIALLNSLLIMRKFEKAQNIQRRLCLLLPDQECVSMQGVIIKLHLGDEPVEYVREMKRTFNSHTFPYPLYYFMYWDLAIFHIFYDEFEDRVDRIAIDSFGKQRSRFYYLKAEYYERKNDIDMRNTYYDSLISYVCENEDTVFRDHPLDMHLGIAYSRRGMKKEAIKIADRLTREWPISRDALNSPEFMIVAAIIYANAGEYELALDLIEEMLSVPGYLTSVLLKRDPIWDTVRNHPRFKEITSKYSGRNL